MYYVGPSLFLSVNGIKPTTYAAFILACCLPLCSANGACSFINQHWAVLRQWLIAEQHSSRVELKSTACSLLLWASGKVIDLLARCCLPLGHPWAASGVCKYHHQSSDQRASLKATLVFSVSYIYAVKHLMNGWEFMGIAKIHLFLFKALAFLVNLLWPLHVQYQLTNAPQSCKKQYLAEEKT